MASDVAINRVTGSPPTYTRIDSTGADGSTRASTSDVARPGITNPVPIPGDATPIHSFWVVLQVETVTAPASTINNLRLFTDGNNSWTGVNVLVATAPTYVQATGSIGVAGSVLNSTNYPTLNAAPVSIFGYTSAAPLTVAGSTSAAEKFGDFIVMQLEVTQSAIAGTLLDENFQILYDET